MKPICLFTGSGHETLATDVAQILGIELRPAIHKRFADGECQVRLLESVRDEDVFVIQGMSNNIGSDDPDPIPSSINDRLIETLLMTDALRRASAKRINLVMPCYPYSRQDKKTKPREPISAAIVGQMLEFAGADRFMCVDLHAEQTQGHVKIPVDNLYADGVIAAHIKTLGWHEDPDDLRIVSPDVSGVSRCRNLADDLGLSIARSIGIIAKRRVKPNQVEKEAEVIGDVTGKRCLLLDDMVDTGGSSVGGANHLIARGAREVHIACTHGVFSSKATETLQNSVFSSVICTDTVPIFRKKQFDKLTVLPIAPLLAAAIERVHRGESVNDLFAHSTP